MKATASTAGRDQRSIISEPFWHFRQISGRHGWGGKVQERDSRLHFFTCSLANLRLSLKLINSKLEVSTVRRIVLLIGFLAVFNTLCFSAEVSQPESSAVCQAAETEQQSSNQDAQSLPLELPSQGAVPVSSGIPDCPATQTCGGGSNTCNGSNPCQANGSISLEDTGSSKCNRNGRTLACIFGTIHIKTQECGHCPCCTAQPFPCICPIDPDACGTAITIVCQ